MEDWKFSAIYGTTSSVPSCYLTLLFIHVFVLRAIRYKLAGEMDGFGFPL